MLAMCACSPAEATRWAAFPLRRAGWSQIFFSTVSAANAEPVLFRAALTGPEVKNACRRHTSLRHLMPSASTSALVCETMQAHFDA